MTLQQLLDSQSIIVIDGALATELERHGADLQHNLWSAKYLLSEPERIEAVHVDYVRAGAQILITASYQATVPGYIAAGFTEAQAHQAITASVRVAQSARARWALDNPASKTLPLIAGSVGPYGAYTADGGEYRGNYGLSHSQLLAFHMPRIATLVAAGVDFIACETIPDLIEAHALAACVAQFPDIGCWIAMSCRDGTTTNAGQSITRVAQELHVYESVVAIGVNCTPPQYVASLVAQIAAHTTKPIVVYPNSGESYDATTKTWSGTVRCADYVAAAQTWVAAGARIIGGCCRTTPEHIRALVDNFADQNPMFER